MTLPGRRHRSRLAALVIAGAGLATGCSETIDVWIANPCETALRVRTYGVPPHRIGGGQPDQTAVVAALSIVKVSEAFSDAAGEDWSIQVEGVERVLPVSQSHVTYDTVVLPAEFCH